MERHFLKWTEKGEKPAAKLMNIYKLQNDDAIP